MSKLFVVLGSGPGIGVTTASQFASQGFNVALVSRNAERLAADAAAVKAVNSAIRVSTYTADTGDAEGLAKTLNQLSDELGAPEVVLFNAARIGMVKIGETTPDYLLGDFKTMNIGLYVTATWALPHLESLAGKPGAHPSFFLSGGGIHARPVAALFSLSMQKAAQHNLMFSLSIVGAPKGIHVAVVNVGGVVSDSDPVINAKNIASSYWKLYQQDKAEWEFEIKIGDVHEMIRERASKGIF